MVPLVAAWRDIKSFLEYNTADPRMACQPDFQRASIAAPATAERKTAATPLAGAFKLRREEGAPAVDGVRVAAVPVVPVLVVEGEVLVGVTTVLVSLLEVEDVTDEEEGLADEEVAEEAVEDPLPVLLVAGPIENEPVVA